MRLATLKGLSLEATAQQLGVDAAHPVLARLHALGIPDKKSEAYRYFDVAAILEKEVEPIARRPFSLEEADKIVITDGMPTHAPKGIRVYYDRCDRIAENHFDPLYYLGHLLSPEVIRIDLDGDTDIEIEHRITRSNALVSYRIALQNQAGRHATLFESFSNEPLENTLVLYGYDVDVASDSTLRMIKNHYMHRSGYTMVASHFMKLARHANAVFKTFDTGSDDALQLLRAELEDYAHLDAGHLLYLNDTARRGTVSQIVHIGQHAVSNQEAKNILENDSRGIFDALIKVEQSAKYTKAHQNSKAILLDESCYMAAKPQLEIYIDELEASHGSTTGQLDEKQLFYLRSRGISEIEARKMLVVAFANTLIDQIKDSRHQETVKATFEEAFYEAALAKSSTKAHA